MKRAIAVSLLLVVFCLILPLLLTGISPKKSAAAPAAVTEQTSAPSPTVQPPTETAESSILDGDIPLRVQTASGVTTITMADYLPMALAGEMPASFDPEALKAQAVALRTYALYCAKHPKSTHPQADVCDDSACCAAMLTREQLAEKWQDKDSEYFEKICAAVLATDGQYLVWEDEPILAVFHSSSEGCTENSADVFSPQPYLVSVSTPETPEAVTNLETTVEVSPEDFAASIQSLYPDADLQGPADTWLGDAALTASGRVASVEIGSVQVSGPALRALFLLRSTGFSLRYDDARFVFSVRGYGHGVGMSQYGANMMAKSGLDYSAILEHYYPGTQLVISVLCT